ncbi:MAG: FimV/HubP family polar landmark protein [Gammaproteobacteria bacterium]
MRKISKTLTLMGLLTPVGANALGVGDIKLQSALNQVLKAEIPLITSASESNPDIRVSLASPTAFASAGIERPYYLSQLRFKPEIKNGRVVVKVSSRDVIREPVLNFLIEVNWPNGRMFREFTVLLDPPSTFDETAIAAARAPKVQSKTVTKPHYPVDQASNYGFRAQPAVAAKDGKESRPQGVDSIRTQRNDSLWVVAKKVNADSSVSQEQMMMALYEANPHAFFKKNMNALKSGQRLRVPAREDVLKISRTKARAELVRHNQEWSSVATANAESNATPEEGQAEGSQKGSAQPEANLKLVSPALGETVADSSSAAARSGPTAKKELATEMLETVKQENEDLRSRLKDAEEQLARMQLMLTLKDKQLSVLQSQTTPAEGPSEKIMDLEAENAHTEGSAGQEQPAEVAANQVASDQIPAKTDGLVGELSANNSSTPEILSESGTAEDLTLNGVPEAASATAENAVPGEDEIVAGRPVEEPAATDQPALNEPVALAQAEGNEPASALEAPVSETIADPVESGSVAAVSTEPVESTNIPETAAINTEPEDSFFSGLFAEPYAMLAGGGGLVLLGLLVSALVRRRNRIIMAGAESILSPAQDQREKGAEDAGAKTVQVPQSETTSVVESSFLSEFTPSDFDALESDHDDVDPLSEADVYLAYGRYQQAEDLIRNAIENYPERHECKLKLLEIHFATEDREAFEAYARELESFKHDKPEFWAKISEMGREICPNSALFESPATTGEHTEPEENFVRPEFSDAKADSFDLGALETQSHSHDLDGDDLGFDMAEEVAESDDLHELGSVDFDTEETSHAFHEDLSDDNSIEFVHDDDGDSGLGVFPEAGEFDEIRTGDETNETLETFEFGNVGIDDSEDTREEGLSDEISEMSDLTDMDEIETKLDLAKAYVDMDDQESARGILSEILLQGSDNQKHEAQALVDVLERKA